MRSKFRKVTGGILAAGVAVALLAAPAGARAAQTNDEFCELLSSDQGVGINFEGLDPDEAEYAGTLVRKLIKTGVPKKVKKALKKIAKVYDRIAEGEPAAEVLDAEQQQRILPELSRFSKYFSANCFVTVPST